MPIASFRFSFTLLLSFGGPNLQIDTGATSNALLFEGQNLAPFGGSTGAEFELSSLAIDGGVVVAGADNEPHMSNTGAGSVSLLEANNTTPLAFRCKARRDSKRCCTALPRCFAVWLVDSHRPTYSIPLTFPPKFPGSNVQSGHAGVWQRATPRQLLLWFRRRHLGRVGGGECRRKQLGASPPGMPVMLLFPLGGGGNKAGRGACFLGLLYRGCVQFEPPGQRSINDPRSFFPPARHHRSIR